MAGNLVVVYDACVLYPAPLRDLLVQLATASVLVTWGIAAQHPDVFISYLIELNPQTVLQAVETIRGRLKNPPQSLEDYLATLGKQGLKNSVYRLRELLDR